MHETVCHSLASLPGAIELQTQGLQGSLQEQLLLQSAVLVAKWLKQWLVSSPALSSIL